MRRKNDAAYKSMFSHSFVVKGFLHDFIREDWIAQLDFSSLERINGNYVNDHLREQMNDVVWKVRLADRELYICILIEFQSRIDHSMALRVANYVTQLYLDLGKNRKNFPLTASGKLPPVLPIVLYNGEPRWNAPLELEELIEPGPGRLPDFRPHMRYLVLDERAIPEEDLQKLKSVAAAIFRLEKAHAAECDGIVHDLACCLAAPEHAELRRDVNAWITRVLLPSKASEMGWQDWKLDREIDLEGVATMLANRAQRWNQELLQKGEAQGLEKGREEGREEGRIEGQAMLRHLLVLRYGQLPDWVEMQLKEATFDQLKSWSAQIFSAATLKDVFGPH
ncbi:Rpn family recombination-promoting nuclease/putative transposase [Chitinimonas arctica]|nr:Rpn family recombination-promoting nuclease/putative transposase [Chitinimonas arctica]